MKISVITAVYNSRSTVGGALNSLLSQTYPFVESVVIDGGSTDGTLAVLERYLPHLSTLLSEADTGIYDALNKGIKLATGDVVGFLHADDVFENVEVLSKIAAVFEDPSVDAVYGDLVYVHHDDICQVIRFWKAGLYSAALLQRGWMPPHPTFYVRRAVYERLGLFNTRYRIAADYDTILRFLAVDKIHAVYIPEVLIRMRSGGISNRSVKNILLKSCEDFDILRRNEVGGLWTLLQKNFSKLSQYWRR